MVRRTPPTYVNTRTHAHAVTYIICATLAALTYLPDPSLSITSFLTRTMPGNFELQGLLIANSVSVALTLLANVFALGLITHKVM